MKVFAAGKIAYETAHRLYQKEASLFETRFPGFFLREFGKLYEEWQEGARFSDNFCIEKNTIELYSKKNFFLSGDFYLREIGEGGVFASLWAACEDLEEILERKPLGCRIELAKIPIEQHVVEILELLKENPYEVSSKRSWLVVGPVVKTEAAEIPAGRFSLTEIGEITNSRERVIVHGDSIRYLSPPARQKKDIENRRTGIGPSA